MRLRQAQPRQSEEKGGRGPGKEQSQSVRPSDEAPEGECKRKEQHQHQRQMQQRRNHGVHVVRKDARFGPTARCPDARAFREEFQ